MYSQLVGVEDGFFQGVIPYFTMSSGDTFLGVKSSVRMTSRSAYEGVGIDGVGHVSCSSVK